MEKTGASAPVPGPIIHPVRNFLDLRLFLTLSTEFRIVDRLIPTQSCRVAVFITWTTAIPHDVTLYAENFSSFRTWIPSVGCPYACGAFPSLDDLVQQSILVVHSFSGACFLSALIGFACFACVVGHPGDLLGSTIFQIVDHG